MRVPSQRRLRTGSGRSVSSRLMGSEITLRGDLNGLPVLSGRVEFALAPSAAIQSNSRIKLQDTQNVADVHAVIRERHVNAVRKKVDILGGVIPIGREQGAF
jgi:hypothetical protein